MGRQWGNVPREHWPGNEKGNSLLGGTESSSMCLESRLEVSVGGGVGNSKSVW